MEGIEAAARVAVGEPIARVEVAASRYATSHATTEVDVVRPDGSTVRLLHKDLSPSSLLPEAAGRRPSFLDDPGREVAVYRHVLPGAELGTARCWAAHGDEGIGEWWLLLERVDGIELWQAGEPEVWQDVARWAARLHRIDAAAAAGADDGHGLLRYDRTHFERWPQRARRFLAGDRAAAAGLDRVLARYGEVVDALAALPPVFVHGELYASNVIVVPGSGRVCAVDWEMAGVGPGLLDLAALVAGDWSDLERSAMVDAYHGALDPAVRPPFADLEADLARCRLHLCVQWLGWSQGWEAPAEHAQDWLARALELTEQLGL
jgi:aminoglycoside phosphotransferase (APT) family kinase protein